MRERREVRITEWERLAAVYASQDAWEKRWPRGVARPWARDAPRFVLIAAGIFAVTFGIAFGITPGTEIRFDRALALLAAAVVTTAAIFTWRSPDPRLRLIAKRRSGATWLARRDLAVRVAKRRAHWGKILERLPQGPHRHPRFFLLGVLPIGFAMSQPLLNRVLPRDGGIVGLGLVTVFVVGAILTQRRYWRRASRFLTEPRCLDCGYGFAGLEERLVTWEDLTVNLGPACCPECGAPWPMIPPQPLSDP